MNAIDYGCRVATKPHRVFVASSTRVDIAAVRSIGHCILGSASTRNPHSLDTVSAQNTGHSNRGISIHVFRSNYTVCSHSPTVDNRKGTFRCSNFFDSRSFLLATGSVKFRSKVR